MRADKISTDDVATLVFPCAGLAESDGSSFYLSLIGLPSASSASRLQESRENQAGGDVRPTLVGVGKKDRAPAFEDPCKAFGTSNLHTQIVGTASRLAFLFAPNEAEADADEDEVEAQQPAPPTPTPTPTPMSAITSPRSSPSPGRGVRLASMRYDIPPILIARTNSPAHASTDDWLRVTTAYDLDHAHARYEIRAANTRPERRLRCHSSPRTPARSSCLPQPTLFALLHPTVPACAATFQHKLTSFAGPAIQDDDEFLLPRYLRTVVTVAATSLSTKTSLPKIMTGAHESRNATIDDKKPLMRCPS
ncbi:hypothetical protein B0H11DRAFT_2286797 [Mycena galericulata]|nr:hypothetical protein B0H11DRAFT_2286797 [Mycena galericulata]